MKKCQFALPLKINHSINSTPAPAEALPVAEAGSLLDSPQDTFDTSTLLDTNNVETGQRDAGPNDTIADPIPISKPHYVVPDWSCTPLPSLCLEVIREGVQVGKIDFSPTKEFIYIGRAPVCDLVLDHQSISRFHAIIQFGSNLNDGLWIYDLSSTHGTWLNKQRIATLQHVPAKVGDFVRFGESSRSYIVSSTIPLDGFDKLELKKNLNFDENELYVTSAEKGTNPHSSTHGIAHGNTHRNPRRTIHKWAQEHSIEFDSSITQSSDGNWQCVLTIPLAGYVSEEDDDELVCTGRGTNDKAATEEAFSHACEQLVSLGLLSLPNAISKRSTKYTEYNTDNDDDYFDRTQSKRRQLQPDQKVVETFESLSKTKQLLRQEISQIEDLIAKLTTEHDEIANQSSVEDASNLESNGDEIDMYLDKLKAQELGTSLQHQNELLVTKQYALHRINRLLEIARPTNLASDKDQPIEEVFHPPKPTNHHPVDITKVVENAKTGPAQIIKPEFELAKQEEENKEPSTLHKLSKASEHEAIVCETDIDEWNPDQTDNISNFKQQYGY